MMDNDCGQCGTLSTIPSFEQKINEEWVEVDDPNPGIRIEITRGHLLEILQLPPDASWPDIKKGIAGLGNSWYSTPSSVRNLVAVTSYGVDFIADGEVSLSLNPPSPDKGIREAECVADYIRRIGEETPLMSFREAWSTEAT